MSKKNNEYEDEDFIEEDIDEEESEDTDYDIPESKEETENKRRLIEEKLDECRLQRELDDEFDF